MTADFQKQFFTTADAERQILSTIIQAARAVAAERLASGAESSQQEEMHHSGVEQSDKFCPPSFKPRGPWPTSGSHQEQKEIKDMNTL